MKPRTKFEKRIVELKDSLPKEPPQGMTDWILEEYKEAVGFLQDNHSYYCGLCGNLNSIEEYMKPILEISLSSYANPCEFCSGKADRPCKPKPCKEGSRCYSLLDIKNSGQPLKVECPHCKKEIRLHVNRMTNLIKEFEACALITFEGIQLLRSFIFLFEYKEGKPVNILAENICNRWISENGTIRTTRKNMKYIKCRQRYKYINDKRNFETHKSSFLLLNDDKIYPGGYGISRFHYHDFHYKNLYNKLDIAPYLEKRGLGQLGYEEIKKFRQLDTEIFHNGCNIIQFIKYLIKYPFIETLVKQRDFNALYIFFTYHIEEIETIIPSYFISKRHNYKPDDLKLWIDMVLFYYKAGKDIRNPKLICPENLQEGHEKAQDNYSEFCERTEKKRKEEWERTRPRDIYWFIDHHPDEGLKCLNNDDYLYELEKIYGGFIPTFKYWVEEYVDETTGDIKTIIRCQSEYGNEWSEQQNDRYKEYFENIKGKFFNIEFGDSELTIKSLDSLEDYKEEGNIMHNCIETNGYAINPDSLVLSVKKDGKSVADVELSLRTFNILQCWGACNKPTPYKRHIEKLIKDNIHIIKERKEKDSQ